MSPKIKYTMLSCALTFLAYGFLSTSVHAGFDWTPPKPKPVAQEEITLDESGAVQNGPLTPELDAPVAAPVTEVDSAVLPVVADDGKKVAGMQSIPIKVEPAPAMAEDINAAPAIPSPPVSSPTPAVPLVTPVYEGFGQDIILALALRDIVPPSYAFAFDRPEYAARTISWDGGRPWLDVLNTALSRHALMARVSGNTVRIQSVSTANAAMVSSSAYEPAPVRAASPVNDRPMDITNAPASDYPDTMESTPAAQELSMKDMVVDTHTKTVWKALPGSTLREVLEDWSKIAKVEMQWMTPYDYPINNTFKYEGTFQEALSSILSSYSRENPKPRGKLYPNAPTGPSVLMIN